jgi:hypothetical protein
MRARVIREVLANIGDELQRHLKAGEVVEGELARLIVNRGCATWMIGRRRMSGR